jgi:cellulose synthase operon protein C
VERFSYISVRNVIIAGAAVSSLAIGGYAISLYYKKSDAEAAFEQAQIYKSKQNFSAAKSEIRKAIKFDPKLAKIYKLQAQIALEQFDGLTARTALERAIALGFPQSSLQHLLGHALWLEGDLNRAEAILNDDSIQKENRAYAERILGRVYMDQGNFDDARSTFDGALKITPKNAELWTDIGRFRLALGDQLGASDAAQYAASLDQNNVRVLEFNGRMIRERYGLMAALPWFERALAVNAQDVPTLEEYGITLGEVGRYRDMLSQARKILSVSRKSGRAYYMQAVIAVRARQYGLAQRILSISGATINEMPGAMLISAISEYELGNFNKATDILDKLVSMQPYNKIARQLLARSKQRAGNNIEALDAIKPISVRSDIDTYSALITGRAFEAQGDRARAAAGLTEASRPSIRNNIPLSGALSLSSAANAANQHPGDARFIIPYIRALLNAGQTDAALTIANKLQANSPGVAASHMMVGDIISLQGRTAEAIQAYQRSRNIAFSEGIMLRLVSAYRRIGQEAKAREILNAFAYFNPQNLSAQLLLAYALLDQKRWDEAIDPLEKIRYRIGYNDSILTANIARAYSGAGQHAQAVSNATIAYKLDPTNPMATLIYAQVLLKSGTRPKAAAELFQKVLLLIPRNKDAEIGLKQSQALLKKAAKKP